MIINQCGVVSDIGGLVCLLLSLGLSRSVTPSSRISLSFLRARKE